MIAAPSNENQRHYVIPVQSSLSHHVPIDQPRACQSCHRDGAKPEPLGSDETSSFKFYVYVYGAKLSVCDSAIRTLDLDGNETLLTNYATNKRELTSINDNKAQLATAFLFPLSDVHDNCEGYFLQASGSD